MKPVFTHVWLLLLFAGGYCPAMAQDPDIESDERSVLEEIFRTSDIDGETPTRARDRRAKRVSVPEGAIRIGCECMNGEFSAAHSTGACSGRAGVRYWLYRTVEQDTVRVLTARHERHPHPLDSAELAETNRPKPKSSKAAVAPVQTVIQPVIWNVPPAALSPALPVPDGGWFDWSDAAAITGGGFTLFLTLRYVLNWVARHQSIVRYALRHLLRFGKRPAARPRRKSTPKTRL
jgi:hypothetical protein